MHASANLLALVQIAADEAGRFHAFWCEPHADRIETMTAIIEVGDEKERRVDLRKHAEVTGNTALRVIDQSFDAPSGRFDLDLVVRNVDSASISYPSLLEVTADRSDCGKVTYLNSLITAQSGRLVFRIPKPMDRSLLLPSEDSLPVHIAVQVEGCELSHGSLTAAALKRAAQHASFFPLAVRFRVYTEAPAAGM